VNRVKLIDFLIQVSDCPIKIEKFYEHCEEQWWESELIHDILTNVESLLEHAPGYLLSDKVNMEKYKQSREMDILLEDIELIRAWNEGQSDEEILRKRKLRILRK
jgi:hypothetical protein